MPSSANPQSPLRSLKSTSAVMLHGTQKRLLLSGTPRQFTFTREMVQRAFQTTHGFMLKMSLMPSGVAAPGGLAGSPSHFSVQVIWTCSPGLWAPSGVSGVAGVAGLAGVVLSWMSWTWAGRTGGEADFDYETGGKRTDVDLHVHYRGGRKSHGGSGNVGMQVKPRCLRRGGGEKCN